MGRVRRHVDAGESTPATQSAQPEVRSFYQRSFHFLFLWLPPPLGEGWGGGEPGYTGLTPSLVISIKEGHGIRSVCTCQLHGAAQWLLRRLRYRRRS